MALFDDNNGGNSGLVRIYSGLDGSIIRDVNGPQANSLFGNAIVELLIEFSYEDFSTLVAGDY